MPSSSVARSGGHRGHHALASLGGPSCPFGRAPPRPRRAFLITRLRSRSRSQAVCDAASRPEMRLTGWGRSLGAHAIGSLGGSEFRSESVALSLLRLPLGCQLELVSCALR